MSSDDSVRPHQHIRRNRQADLLGRFQIDDELKLRRLLHGEIGGLGAFQNLVHISSGAPVQVEEAHAVGHKPTGFDVPRLVVYRREPALYREVCNLCSLRTDDGPLASTRTASARPLLTA